MRLLNREIKVISESTIAGWELLIIILTRDYIVLCSNLSIKNSQHKRESLLGFHFRVIEILLCCYMRS